MSIALHRCRICGEVYFGSHPSHCPHCGAHGGYMVPISDWKDENLGVELTDVSRKNLEKTKDLEFHASRLYRASAKKSRNDQVVGFFKYLAKIEREHYSVACKLLKVEASDEINGLGDDVKDTDAENLAVSKKLEETATKLYLGFMDAATEPRVKEYFKALAEVESDHIKLDETEIAQI